MPGYLTNLQTYLQSQELACNSYHIIFYKSIHFALYFIVIFSLSAGNMKNQLETEFSTNPQLDLISEH